MRLLRIVPDNTTFDFIRFRRVSFPISAVLSILAIVLYFTHGLNFGIDFIGGTLIEVQSKTGPADIAKMRTTLGELGLGEVQLQEFGGPENVLIRLAQQPGGEQAQQAAVQKVQGALGDSVDYRRVEVVGPRVSGELLHWGIIGIFVAIGAILISTVSALPNSFNWISPSPSCDSVERIVAMSIGPDLDCTSIRVPPMKSMPKFRPWVK